MSQTLVFFRHAARTLAMTTVLGCALALGFSLFLPMQYGSSVRLLITQTSATGLDPYTAIKTTERISQSLSELMHTSTFYDNTLQKAQGFDVAYFPVEAYAKRRAWKDAISSSISAGTGVMTVTAFHPMRDQARLLVEAAARELSEQATNYFGQGVRVQVIDAPLASRWYAKPDFIMNSLAGAGIGLLLGAGWVLIAMARKGYEE